MPVFCWGDDACASDRLSVTTVQWIRPLSHSPLLLHSCGFERHNSCISAWQVQLVAKMRPRRELPGKEICRQGDSASRFWVLTDGQVRMAPSLGLRMRRLIRSY